jgi:hypothetical protein
MEDNYKDKVKPMEAKEKEKITEAMTLCESKIQSFFSYLDSSMDKKYSGPFKDFLLANTFFAGGVFRSTLSSTPVNDIDVFFKSLDNVIEFKHLVMSAPTKIFKETTENGSYNYKSGKGPKLSFTTKNYGDPERVISRFDLTFNMHYYDMQRMEMRFDRDTFQKAGVLNYGCMEKSGSIARTLRFMNEGWKVEQSSIIEVLKAFWNKEVPFTLGSSGQASMAKLGPINKVYTEADYFGRTVEKKSGAAKKDVMSMTMPTDGWGNVPTPSDLRESLEALALEPDEEEEDDL